MKLQDECSEGTAWDTFNNVKAFDFNEKKGLAGEAWPSWMSDDYTSPGAGHDASLPSSGAIFRWGNKKQGIEVAGESQLNDGPTGPIAKYGVWNPNSFEKINVTGDRLMIKAIRETDQSASLNKCRHFHIGSGRSSSFTASNLRTI